MSVIDVLQQPEQARDNKIIATPTLVREFPLPNRRIIGDLSDHQQVLVGLDLSLHDGTEASSPIGTDPSRGDIQRHS